MSNDEKRDIEDRINDAMAKIVSDTAGEPQPENKNNRSAAHKSARPSKSARPRKITYVPIDESEFELDIKTAKGGKDRVFSEIVANIPIKRVRKMGKNKY